MTSVRPAAGAGADATTVSAGFQHTCALTSAGGVSCWGENLNGQLGDGTNTSSSTPVSVVGLSSGVAAVSSGLQHTCALTTAGGVKCWGFNGFGQLGDGTTTNRNTPVDVTGLTSGVAAISAGRYHACVVTTTGGAKCWGSNFWDQLGDGSALIFRSTPVNVSGLLSGVAAVSAGDFHTCALTTAGGLRCWGDNLAGQLGDGTTTDRMTPVDVSGLISGVAAVSAGRFHTCALTTTGGVKCWGSNSFGQLGDGTTGSFRSTPADVSGLSSGGAAVSASGGDPDASHTCAVTTAGGVKCWGKNLAGQLGDGTTIDRNTPVDVSTLVSGVAGVSTGGQHTCARLTVGTVKCWGDNALGQLGDGTSIGQTTPVEVVGFGPPPPAIVIGGTWTFATSTGNRVEINVTGLPLQGLGAADITVAFDPAVLAITACDTGDLSGTCNPTAPGGPAQAIGSATPAITTEPVIVAGLVFDCVATSAASSALTITVNSLADGAVPAQPISTTVQNGTVNCPEPTLVLGGAWAFATSTGNRVEINVTGLPAQGLGATDITVAFDPAVLAITACDTGDFAGACNPVAPGGPARAAGFAAPAITIEPVIIAGLVFDCIAASAASSALTITVNEILDGTAPGAVPIAAIVQNGTVDCANADNDGDGVDDALDNCPAWPNPFQNLPPWTVPVGDPDCDSFTTTIENFAGTDPNDPCANTAGANDEADDRWPADTNDNQFINTFDVVPFIPTLNSVAPGPPYTARLDLNASGSINTFDVVPFIQLLNKPCAP